MKIIINKLSLLNFKGERKREIIFSEKENYIYAKNRGGKTTLFDAFLWVVFNKDSSGRKSFEIKTLDKNNKPFHKLSHEVIADLNIDGQNIILKKIFKEKWVKKRGTSTEEFSGHETEYFWNDVPMKESDYQNKMGGIIDETLFRLLTNTSYFNSLDWTERRSVLMQLGGEINDSDIIEIISTVQNKTSVGALISALNQNKTIVEFKAEIAAKKKKIKDELIMLPSRIDEAKRSLPDVIEYNSIEKLIEKYNNDLELIERTLLDKNSAQKQHQEKVSNLLNERNDLKQRIIQIEFEEKSKVLDNKNKRLESINELRRELSKLNADLNNLRLDISSANSKKATFETERAHLLNKWHSINAEKLEFNESEFACPACKREFENIDVDKKKTELTNNFNLTKSKRLAEVNEEGKQKKSEIESLETNLSNLQSEEQTLKSKVTIVEGKILEAETEDKRLSEDDDMQVLHAVSQNLEYKEIIKKIDVLNEKINAPAPVVDNSELINRKKEIQIEIDGFKKQISSKEIRDSQLQRIDELTAQEQTLNNELANFEGIEFTIQEFMKTKMDELEKRINNKFQLVKFKMFEEQINGGQKETCVTLIDGVPYSDANTASRIQAGLDIINTLSKHYNIQAPVWVDNRESVTDLPETDCQLISLIVSPADEKIRMEYSNAAAFEVA